MAKVKLSVLIKSRFRWRRVRHVLTGRQNALGVDRMGVLNAVTRKLVVSTSPTKVSADFIAFLRRLDWRCGSQVRQHPRARRAGAGQRTRPHEQGQPGDAGGAALDHS